MRHIRIVMAIHKMLKLPAQIQVALKNREIDMGHARALLSLDDPKDNKDASLAKKPFLRYTR